MATDHDGALRVAADGPVARCPAPEPVASSRSVLRSVSRLCSDTATDQDGAFRVVAVRCGDCACSLWRHAGTGTPSSSSELVGVTSALPAFPVPSSARCLLATRAAALARGEAALSARALASPSSPELSVSRSAAIDAAIARASTLVGMAPAPPRGGPGKGGGRGEGGQGRLAL